MLHSAQDWGVQAHGFLRGESPAFILRRAFVSLDAPVEGTAHVELDAVGRLLDQIVGYYHIAPPVWWTLVGLLAFGMGCWAYAKRGTK